MKPFLLPSSDNFIPIVRVFETKMENDIPGQG